VQGGWSHGFSLFTSFLAAVHHWLISHPPTPSGLGPLHMSPVTRLARLPGQILMSVYMGNFSLVDWDEIQETKPKWCNTDLYCSQLL